MALEKRPQDEYVLSWFDLKNVLKRSKKTILGGSLLFALLGSAFTLSRDVAYTAKGTFREKNKQTNSNEKTLSALLLSGGATAAESMAISTIKSRRVLEKVALKLGLQGQVQRLDERSFIAEKSSHYLNNIVDNAVVEEAYLLKKYKPVINDPPSDLVVKDIVYEGEVALSYRLEFNADDSFIMYDTAGGIVAEGSLEDFIKLKNVSFSIHKKDGPLPRKSYVLSISPLHKVAESLLANLTVEADKLDKTLLKINYVDVDRHKASLLLNTLMNTYREFLVDEHVRVTAEQVAYLKERQEDMDSQLVVLMEDHAVNLTSNDASIEFLVKTLQNYKSKLLNIDLEVKHLEKAQQEGLGFFERHSADGESSVVQNLLGEIRKYRQQADTLELALRNTHVHSSEILQTFFDRSIEELEETHRVNKDTKRLLAEVQKGNIVPPPEALVANAKYLVRSWYQKINEADQARLSEGKDEQELLTKREDYERCEANYVAYLQNLLHLFDVQEKTIKDRLTHQQNPHMEFQGIDLETANGLYLTYSRELHSLEADLAQKEFVIQQLGQPEFEISSINSIMEDTISREIINRTSSLMLTLKDESNRTTKELERLKRDIDIQKGFLTIHLKQMCDILRLREQLLGDKIHSLQSIILELIRQKISIQEKHLVDFINSRLNNLKNEHEVISQHQSELQSELDLLPEKWASQKLIDQHMQSNLSIVHQIASMIESKTIAESLEVSQSAPFDEAVTPVLPRDPRLLLFAAIGAIGGSFLVSCFCLLRSAASGVEATEVNLQSLHQNVAGKLPYRESYSNVEDLSEIAIGSLRRLTSHLTSGSEEQRKGRFLALIEGDGPYYEDAFAALLSKKGFRVILIPLSFDDERVSSDEPGLLDVLEGRAAEAKIVKGLYFDYMKSGGKSPFSNELLGSLAFKTLIEQLSKSYAYIIGYSSAEATSPEAENLIHIADGAGVTLTHNTLDSLQPYFEAAQNGKPISFLLP